MKRWLFYFLAGVLFGVFDWFFTAKISLVWAPNSDVSAKIKAAAYAFNVIIWFVPLVPVVVVEAWHAVRAKSAILAGMFTWGIAILAYYTTYAIQLSLGNVAGWEHLNILAGKENEFWTLYWEQFKRLILLQIAEWIWVALVGGAFFGWLAFLSIDRKAQKQV